MCPEDTDAPLFYLYHRVSITLCNCYKFSKQNSRYTITYVLIYKYIFLSTFMDVAATQKLKILNFD